jgi:3-carboxy-cis,cis-muconate cycloisomerase
MPQKQNPVAASAMVALARHVIGLAGLLQGSALHRQQRDGAAWFGEWLALPQLCICAGRMLGLAGEVVEGLRPDPEAMARVMEDGQGLIHAEALTFALAEILPRPEAAARVKALCEEARGSGTSLLALAARDFPETDWPKTVAARGMGVAEVEALDFAAKVRRGLGASGET